MIKLREAELSRRESYSVDCLFKCYHKIDKVSSISGIVKLDKAAIKASV